MSTQMKGQAFLSFEHVVRSRWGDASWAKVCATAPIEARRLIEGRSIMSVGWYPIAWYNALHVGLEAVQGPDAAAVIGSEGTRRDVHMVFRWVLMLFSPETLLKQATRVLASYLKGCTLSVSFEGAQQATLRYVADEPFARGTWAELAEGTRTFVELSGAKDAKATVVSGGAADARELEVRVTWA